MIEIAVNVGSPGLANRIKTYVSILTTYKQALTIKEQIPISLTVLTWQLMNKSEHILGMIIGDLISRIMRDNIVRSTNILIFFMRRHQSISSTNLRSVFLSEDQPRHR